MTGDGRALGSKFGISFYGKWVWLMKDFIDVSFMQLFAPQKLFVDYENRGTEEPIENFQLFDESTEATKTIIEECKKKVAEMDVKTAGEIFGCDADEEDFHLRFQILTRMNTDEEFREGVIANFNPPYAL
jgi:hypothetical protein